MANRSFLSSWCSVAVLGMLLGVSFVPAASVYANEAAPAAAVAAPSSGQPNVNENSASADVNEDNNDPYESVNRAIFDFNDTLDQYLILPLAKTWRFIIPEVLRERISHVLTNMGEPVILLNNVLQGRFEDAGTTLGRFTVNSVLGMGGMFEVASNKFDLERQSGDFGQTLHTWGAGSGPYLVLPLFGPSNPRDAVGLGVDMVSSPWGYVAGLGTTMQEDTFMIVNASANMLTRREEAIEQIDSLRSGSVDYYAQMRSVWQQYRDAELGITSQQSIPVFDEQNGNNKSASSNSTKNRLKNDAKKSLYK